MKGRDGQARAADLVRLQIAWAHALCRALRRQDPWRELQHLLPEDMLRRLRGTANVATALPAEMGRLLAEADQAGTLDSMRLAALDRTLSELANAQGGLERIKNTPLPRQFDWFLRVFIAALPAVADRPRDPSGGCDPDRLDGDRLSLLCPRPDRAGIGEPLRGHGP